VIKLTALFVFAALTLPILRGSEPIAQPIDDDSRIVEAVETLLHEEYPHEAHRLKPTLRRIMSGTPLPGGVLRATFAKPTPELPSGTAVVLLDADADRDSKISALVHIAVFDSVLITSTAIASDEIIGPQNIRTVWRETTNQSSRVIAARRWHQMRTHETVLVASRNLPSKRVLSPRDIRVRPDVAIGSKVQLSIIREAISISIDCIARESAIVGDELRLYSKSTKRMYRALLDAPNRATWLETL
jgi:flagella basal body P-ring formation protein FlgA